jgi:predicted DNA-binding transcriptional regulator AlpA
VASNEATDIHQLNLLIENGVHWDILEKQKLLKSNIISLLYQNDILSISEVSSYLRIGRNTVYRRFSDAVRKRRNIARRLGKKHIRLKPADVFEDYDEYIDFLKWRSGIAKDDYSKKVYLSASDVIKITGLSKWEIVRLLDKKIILGVRNKKGLYITTASFKSYIEGQMEKLKCVLTLINQ